jgi:hypothetical protein
MGNIADGAPEDQTVRQYRFLLRTAPMDALLAAHHEALDRLPDDTRVRVLTAVQDGLVAGHRLGPGDTVAMARLVSIGERRTQPCHDRAALGSWRVLAGPAATGQPSTSAVVASATSGP